MKRSVNKRVFANTRAELLSNLQLLLLGVKNCTYSKKALDLTKGINSVDDHALLTLSDNHQQNYQN